MCTMTHTSYNAKPPPRGDNIRAVMHASYDAKSAPPSDNVILEITGWYGLRIWGGDPDWVGGPRFTI